MTRCSCVTIYSTFRPVIEDMLCDVAGRVARTEQVLLGLPAHQNQSEVDLQHTTMPLSYLHCGVIYN